MHRNQTFWSFEPVFREVARLGRVAWRRRWPFVAAAAVPILATVIYVATAPDRYAGTARVIIGKDAGTLELGPGFAPKSNELENQLEMIKSGEVIANAVAAGRRLYPQEPPDSAEIKAALKVKALSGTDIIEIKTEARSGERAAALANLVADAYIEAHLRDRRQSASKAKEFIEGQLALYERRLRASERELEDYKRTAGVASLAAETTELIKAEAGFNQALEKARVDLAVAENKQAYYEYELRETQEKLLVEATNVSSPVARQLQEKLITLEYRYANLILKGYSLSHPELSALDGEIDLTKQKLAEAVVGAANEEPKLNLFTKIENLALELDVARAEVAALSTRKRELAGTVAAGEARLAALPEKELELARLVREKEANESIYMMLLEKREEARIAVASEVGTARVFSREVPPTKPFAPRRKQSLFLGILAGLLFGVAAVASVEYFDRTVKSPAAAQQVTGAPVLGVIPVFGRRRGNEYYRVRTGGKEGHIALPAAGVVMDAPKSPTAEAFRQLYAHLAHLFVTNGIEKNVAVGLTSARAQEGKSTVASNVAVCFAQLGTPTVLVDADVERSTLGDVYGVAGRPGLADFLRGEATWEGIIVPTDIENLAIVNVGTDPSTPPALLASPRLGSLVERAKQEFGLVLVDVPPVFPVADVALVAGVIKMFLLVVRAGVVSPQELDRAVHTIKQVGGEVLGVVLNAAEPSETYGYGYYHYRQYYKREGAEVHRQS